MSKNVECAPDSAFLMRKPLKRMLSTEVRSSGAAVNEVGLFNIALFRNSENNVNGAKKQ